MSFFIVRALGNLISKSEFGRKVRIMICDQIVENLISLSISVFDCIFLDFGADFDESDAISRVVLVPSVSVAISGLAVTVSCVCTSGFRFSALKIP